MPQTERETQVFSYAIVGLARNRVGHPDWKFELELLCRLVIKTEIKSNRDYILMERANLFLFRKVELKLKEEKQMFENKAIV